MISPRDEIVGAQLVQTAGGWCWIAGLGSKLKGSSLPHRIKRGASQSLGVAFPNHRLDAGVLEGLQVELVAVFDGSPTNPSVRCDWSRVTAFQKDVYQALRRVPAGRLITYGGLAQRSGHPGAARGVGSAMAQNPFAPFVPCHRVVAANGRLGGFSAAQGLQTKRLLLRLEGHEVEETRVVNCSVIGC